MHTPGDPARHYLARMEWRRCRHPRHSAVESASEPERSPPRRRPQRRRQARLSRRVEDLGRGDGRSSMDRRGQRFLWLSERDGWQHVYRVTSEGGTAIDLIRFDADVTDLLGVDEARGWVYFLASPRTRRNAICIAQNSTARAARAGHPGFQPGPHLRHRARQRARVSHLLADGRPAGHGRRRSAGASLAASAHRPSPLRARLAPC